VRTPPFASRLAGTESDRPSKMDGVLIIDKPAGMTSHDVVNRVRRVLGTKRVGHTGTLDPFATGAMVILVGKATRLAQFIDKAAKEYVAEVRFGFETETGDLTGKPLDDRRPVEFTAEDIQRVLRRFQGAVEQIPPMYSAKKVGGQKLYELARKGKAVERKPVRINIFELEMLNANLLGSDPTASIRVVCSAGTYVRTLAEDIGKALGAGAHLASLRRLAAGQFTLDGALDLDQLAESSTPASLLRPLVALVSDLPKLELPSDRVEPTTHGLASRAQRNDLTDADAVAMFAPDGGLVAIGRYDAAEQVVRPKIVLT